MQDLIDVKFLDGSVRSFPKEVSVRSIAESIGPRLAAAMLAVKVDGRIVDHDYIIHDSASVEIITDKSDEALEIIRHSTAHLMAQAVKQLFPEAQVTVGPVTEDGFYYDFYYPDGFTEEHFEQIEQRMHALVKEKLEVKRTMMSRDKAKAFFADLGEAYKAKIIEELIEDQEVSLYQQGEFIDLCRGPHVPNTSFLGAFKLMKVSGAYWRGDQNNEMLQRIYGTAWRNKKELKLYLERLELAKKRDHRLLGAKLDWFHFQEEAPGLVFWHADGWSIYQNIVQVIRECYKQHGYQEINTPQIVDRKLWEQSGHWDKYAENMFVVESASRVYAVKPMSCPCHVETFKQGLKSYKDLPIRYAEFGCCHRCEPSGTLHGLMRLRGFVQDDGHIFCEESQIGHEVEMFINQTIEVYKKFGFDELSICLSTRPDKRVGEDLLWDKAEQALATTLDKVLGVEQWELHPGEGAFYGPKIEFSLKDSLGRIWQCGTIQLDFSMPKSLGAHYIDEHGAKQHPVMLHRAILGSLERFIGILIEETDGRLPMWLMPYHCKVLTISTDCNEYATKISEELKKHNILVDCDLRNEKIGYKIREHSVKRVPFLLICGNKEKEMDQVNVRTQHGENLGNLSLSAVITLLREKLEH